MRDAAKEASRLENLIITQVLRQYLGRNPWEEDYKSLTRISKQGPGAYIHFQIKYKETLLGTVKTRPFNMETGEEIKVAFEPEEGLEI